MKRYFFVVDGAGRFETSRLDSIGGFMRTMYPDSKIIESGEVKSEPVRITEDDALDILGYSGKDGGK